MGPGVGPGVGSGVGMEWEFFWSDEILIYGTSLWLNYLTIDLLVCQEFRGCATVHLKSKLGSCKDNRINPTP